MGRLSTVILSALVATSACLPTNIVEKDVVIIGGGAGGAHAALRLKDMGQDVVVIEKQELLKSQGGCVDSYTDPVTGGPIDYGVNSFIDYANATDFVARLNIPIAPPIRGAGLTRYVDFTTGQELSGYVSPNFTVDVATALQKYIEHCEKYEDILVPGYWNFPPASKIPEDLLIPFGEFAVKYGIEAAVPIMFASSGLGAGNFAEALTLTVMQTIGGMMARALLGTQGSFTPASRRNQDIYDAIAVLLGDDVMYQTMVTSSIRTDEGVTVTVQDQTDGSETTIHASRLLLAINPTLDRMGPFDIDERELAVFCKWKYVREYPGLVSHPSLTAANTTVANLPLAAEPDNYLYTPRTPFVDGFAKLGTPSNLFRVIVIGDETTDSKAARALLQTDFQNLVDAGILPPSYNTPLDIVAFSEHGPMHLDVSVEDYRAGFIQDQYALQGYRSTWYTGGGYSSQYQTIIWAYNEILLSKMLSS